MAEKIGVSLDEWLLKEIDAKREEVRKNRSEMISELCARGLGFSKYEVEGNGREDDRATDVSPD